MGAGIAVRVGAVPATQPVTMWDCGVDVARAGAPTPLIAFLSHYTL